jgi:hypothetical protein
MIEYLKGFNNKSTWTGLGMVATGIAALKFNFIMTPGEAIQTIFGGLGLIFVRRAIEVK